MNIIYSALLGIVQGLTEFLPVSSSGHLVLIQQFIPGFRQPGVLFDVVLHLATTLAVLVYFRNRLLKIVVHERRYLGLLLLGTLPAAVFGIIFNDFLVGLFARPGTLGLEFLLTGVLVIATDYLTTRRKGIGIVDSLLIGTAQALAIIPAVSRSGATIFAGSALGIDKERVAEFSFLLSIPAILGANVWELVRHGGAMEADGLNYLFGFLAALVAGWTSIRLVLSTLPARKFRYFGIYCLILGSLIILAGK